MKRKRKNKLGKTKNRTITVREWFEENQCEDDEVGAIAFVIGSEGRGEVELEDLGEGKYAASLSDDELNQFLDKPRESDNNYSERLLSESMKSVFDGDDNIENVARWFAEEVGYSDDDKEQIINEWKDHYGLGPEA